MAKFETKQNRSAEWPKISISNYDNDNLSCYSDGQIEITRYRRAYKRKCITI